MNQEEEEGDVLGSEGSEVLHCSPSRFNINRVFSQISITGLYQTSQYKVSVENAIVGREKRLVNKQIGQKIIWMYATQDQRQDAANWSVRSLGEHFHHQQERYENISL